MASNLERVGVLLVAEGISGFLGAVTDAGKAVVGFLGDSINIAGDFEQTMNKLGAVSGATAEEIAQIGDKAKALGADLTLPATSAVDAGNAMLELSKAGFTVQQTMDAAKGTLQLAAAANIEEAKAAEIAANAINAFGLAASDATFVADLLAATANSSSVEITDVADSYKMAGAVFSNFQAPVVGAKQAMVDLTTAVGLLGNAGIKGSDAGTSLKQALLQLTGPSKKAKGLMIELAQSIGETGDIAYTADGQMRSFPEILGLVSRATKDLTDEKRNQYITDIFGADASRAILILMRQGPDAWAAMEAAVTRQGAAQALATAQTQGFKGALEGAKSQLETLQLTIGQKFLPILATLLSQYISPGIAQLTTFAEAIFGNKEAVDALNPTLASVLGWLQSAQSAWDLWNKGVISTRTALDTLIPGLGDLWVKIEPIATFVRDNMVPILSGLADILITNVGPALTTVGAVLASLAVMSVVGSIVQLIGVIGALGAVFTVAGGGIAGVVAVLGGPLIAATAAVALAVGVLTLAWQNDWFGIQTALTNFWVTTGQPIFDQLKLWLQTNIPIAIQTATTFWNTVLWPALQTVGGWIQANLFPIFSTVATWLKDNIPIAVTAAALMWNTVLWPALKKVWEFISGSVIPIFVALFNVNFAIAKKVTEALAGLWQNVLWPALQKVGSFITDTVVPAFVKASDYLSVTFGPTLEKFTGWLGDVTGGFGGVSDAISGVVDWLNDMAAKIDSIELPDWLTPGSPTPFEIGLRGIGDALKTDVNPALATMGTRMAALAPFSGNASVSPPASASQIAAGGSSYSTAYNQTVNMPIYTNNSPAALQQSWAVLQASMP